MQYLNQKAVKQIFKGKKQLSKDALIAIDRKVGIYLEKLCTIPREKRLTEFVVNYYKLT